MMNLVLNKEDKRLYVVINQEKEYFLPVPVMYNLNKYNIFRDDITEVVNFKLKGVKHHIVTVRVIENGEEHLVNILTSLHDLIRTDKFDLDYIKLLKEHELF